MNATPTTDRPWIPGVVLIAIGLILLAAQMLEHAGGVVLGGLGIMFLVLYAATRAYGFLVPGAILAGLAVGVGLEEYGYGMQGSVVVLGLGAGFLAIYLVGALTGASAHWWPLVPGGILVIVGGAQAIGGTQAAEVIGRWWPLVLVVIGVVILVRRSEIGSKPPEPPRG